MKSHSALEKIFENKQLAIFDVDGTLVDMMQLHIHVIREAIFAATGVQIHRDTHISDYFGIPEYQSIRLILKNKKIPFTENTIREIQRDRDHLFPKIAKKTIATRILPGVHELLSSLHEKNKMVCTITGNRKPVGKMILDTAKLTPYFDYCIFSDDLLNGKKIVERHDMIQIAAQRFRKMTTKSIAKKQMIAIGDTTHDVEAAHAEKIDSLAVATGTSSIASLRASKPTFLLRNFKPNARLL